MTQRLVQSRLQTTEPQRLALSGDPDILGQLSADLDLKTFFTDEEIQEITGLSDGSTDTDRPHLFSGCYQIIDAAFEHYRATGFPYRNLPTYVPNAASKSDCYSLEQTLCSR
jgi:hypothetical protein